MNIEIDGNSVSYDFKKFQKMQLIYNALEDGWKISKQKGNYFFKKKHHNKAKYFSDDILNEFLTKYLEHNLSK